MKFFVLLFLVFLFSCSTSTVIKNQAMAPKPLLDSVMYWHHKDYELDKIPGISLERFYAENTQKPKQKTIIVATIDTQIDKNHNELKNAIWTNPNEIANNGIDDDHNGYIDDIHGWNFLGSKGGDYVVWANFEYTRILRHYKDAFENKTIEEILPNQKNEFLEYQRAFKFHKKEYEIEKNFNYRVSFLKDILPVAKDSLKRFFPQENYTDQQLDSLYNKYKMNDKHFKQRMRDNDKDLGSLIHYIIIARMTELVTIEEQIESIAQSDSVLTKNLEINFNDRQSIGDNSLVLEKGYGNNNIGGKRIPNHRPLMNHNTEVSGVIAGLRSDNSGVYGFSDRIKIMPLAISASGDEHDKDIAMAIYYAVDNGAKIINMSFGKDFSLHKDWVFEAMKYAEKHNVLIISCSGNDSTNTSNNPAYPNDQSFDGSPEVVSNYICVGSVSRKVDENFVSSFSNYSNKNVDIFAPGDDIYTIKSENNFVTDGGTSLATPMVSGTAALLWLYYPSLTVQQVKEIILTTGTTYEIEVKLPDNPETKTAFSNLSKSGKVLNVYNAMKMAKEIVAKKK